MTTHVTLKVRVKRLLPKNKFARSVSVLAGGTAIGQLIAIIGSPVITRLYSPEDFGVLAVFASMLTILGVIASLRYQLAIPLPESEVEAANVTLLSLLVVLIMVVLTTVIVVPWRYDIAEVMNTPLLAEYIWLVPLGLLLIGIYETFYYLAIRLKAFPAIAKSKLTQSLCTVSFQLIFFGLGPIALLLGRVFGQATGSGTLASIFFSQRQVIFRNASLSIIGKAALRYRRFPLYSSCAGLFNTGSSQLPPLVFAMFYSASAAGLYMLAQRVIALPMALLASSIADVFMPNAVEAIRESQLRNSVASLQRQLAWIALPPTAVLFIIAPEVFRIAFGSNWEEAGHMVRWLTPMLFLQFIASPLSRIFIAMERQALGLALQANLFFLRLGSLGLAKYMALDLLEAVIWYGMASGFGYFVYVGAIAVVTGNSLSAYLMTWVSCLPWLIVITAPLLGFSLLADSLLSFSGLAVLIASFALLFIYYKTAFSWR